MTAPCPNHTWTSIGTVDGRTFERSQICWMCLHCRSYSTTDPHATDQSDLNHLHSSERGPGTAQPQEGSARARQAKRATPVGDSCRERPTAGTGHSRADVTGGRDRRHLLILLAIVLLWGLAGGIAPPLELLP